MAGFERLYLRCSPNGTRTFCLPFCTALIQEQKICGVILVRRSGCMSEDLFIFEMAFFATDHLRTFRPGVCILFGAQEPCLAGF